MIKEAIQKEGIALVHIYAPNKGASKYIKQILMDTKGKINSNTVIEGISTLTPIDWSSGIRPRSQW